MHEKIEGIVPALITPFDRELSLNTSAIHKVVEPLLDAGCAGLFVCDATGEPTTMTVDERKKMAEATIKEVVNEIPVIIHVGATDIYNAVLLAKHAEKAGATAVGSRLLLDRGSLDGDVDYYKIIGSSTKLPFYVYLRADMAKGDITPEQFLQKMTKVPNFRGIKFTDLNFYFFAKTWKVNYWKTKSTYWS